MTKEHCVSVDNNKYTFVSKDGRISILRYGKPWIEHHELQGPNALYSIMCELDAARVVLQAARNLADRFEMMPLPMINTLVAYDEPVMLVRVLAQHDRLVTDHTPPSEWAE